MKPLKTAPARRRDVVTHRARTCPPSRTLTLASLALLITSALVSSADATRTNLEGVGAALARVLPASVNAPGPRVSPAVPTALTAKTALAPPLPHPSSSCRSKRASRPSPPTARRRRPPSTSARRSAPK